jgi:hypothetical protein
MLWIGALSIIALALILAAFVGEFGDPTGTLIPIR